MSVLYDKKFVLDIRGKTALQAKDALIPHIKVVLDFIAKNGEKKAVQEFYIGTAYIGKTAKPFNLVNFDTWDKAGIQGRWIEHQKAGDSGMVVIAAIGQESIPPPVKDVTKEEYTLALGQMLIQHYKLFENDKKIVNSTFDSDDIDGDKSPAYALYIAYSTAAKKSASKGR